MNEFKSKTIIIFKTFIYYILVMSVVVWMIYNLIIMWKGIQLSYPMVVGMWGVLLILACTLIWYDSIRIVIQNGEMIVYRGRQVMDRFVIMECKMNSRITTKLWGSNCQLIIEFQERVEWLDCSMLGKKRFKKLLEAIGFNNPIKVRMQ